MFVVILYYTKHSYLLVKLFLLTLTAERTVDLVDSFDLLHNLIDLAVFTASHDVVDSFELFDARATAESIHFSLEKHIKHATLRLRNTYIMVRQKLLIISEQYPELQKIRLVEE